MEPCYVTREIPLGEPWKERVLITREPPRDRRDAPIERGICGLVDGTWVVAHGRFEDFWRADGYVRRTWPHLHRVTDTLFWVPVVEYRRLGG
jgi:hypothetical protein